LSNRIQESGARIQLGILCDTTTGSVHRWWMNKRRFCTPTKFSCFVVFKTLDDSLWVTLSVVGLNPPLIAF
ncbi:hypothetical protein, partial [Nostoc sp.]|uniref:hypothetical protein n=1 Tax=Nostoc sp. TaxID=1180 RepID=UPI002FF8E691